MEASIQSGATSSAGDCSQSRLGRVSSGISLYFIRSCVPFAGASAAKCQSSCEPDKKLMAIDHCLLGGEKKIKRLVDAE